MFDIGFWELMIIGLVALVVVGPERLPKLAYTAGKWLGKGRSMLNAVKSEIDKEIKAEELKQILEKQRQQLNPLEDVIEETSSTVRGLAQEGGEAIRDAEKGYASETQASPATADSGKAAAGHDQEPTAGR
jgi:sec-independent protein translocase protein TatB